jgi:chaperonin GroES
VKVQDAIAVTPGGIVLPDNAKEKQERGEVLAVGPGGMLNSGERFPLTVQVGDVVVFSKFGGMDVEIDGETVKVLRETDLICKIQS